MISDQTLKIVFSKDCYKFSNQKPTGVEMILLSLEEQEFYLKDESFYSGELAYTAIYLDLNEIKALETIIGAEFFIKTHDLVENMPYYHIIFTATDYLKYIRPIIDVYRIFDEYISYDIKTSEYKLYKLSYSHEQYRDFKKNELDIKNKFRKMLPQCYYLAQENLLTTKQKLILSDYKFNSFTTRLHNQRINSKFPDISFE